MSPDARKEQDKILSDWINMRLKAEHAHSELYRRGRAVLHAYAAAAHARAALALQKELEGAG